MLRLKIYVNNAMLNPDRSGIEVSFKSLPEMVQQYISGEEGHPQKILHLNAG